MVKYFFQESSLKVADCNSLALLHILHNWSIQKNLNFRIFYVLQDFEDDEDLDHDEL